MPLFPRLTSHSADWQGLDYLNVTDTNSSVSVDAANTTVPIRVAVTLRNTVAMAGQYVVFDADGSFMMDKRTGEVTSIQEDDKGSYLMDLWVPVGKNAPLFSWQA